MRTACCTTTDVEGCDDPELNVEKTITIDRQTTCNLITALCVASRGNKRYISA